MQPPVTEFRRTALTAQIERVVNSTPAVDIHTHLYDPSLGGLLQWGIDDLLVYHYLVAEFFRRVELPYADFWELSKQAQADLIWEQLFVQHSPVSEACRGVLTTLHRLGLDVARRDLPALRQWFAEWPVDTYITRCLELANVACVHMTNSPFDELERPVWQRGLLRDSRFIAALRVDPLLLAWPESAVQIAGWGYGVGEGLSAHTLSEVRRFLADWTRRMEARYLMVSLPPDFAYPAATDCAGLLEGAILPHCREFGFPLALMLGVKRGVNPHLRLAGDGVGRSDLSALANLCEAFPENKFMVTVLSMENQHELCVLARKFRNLHLFGCWWFTNTPSMIETISRMRIELLGTGFTAQHSDARVLDQLIYKWDHTRRVLSRVLADKYSDLAMAGWEPGAAEIERDVKSLMGGAFEKFLQ